MKKYLLVAGLMLSSLMVLSPLSHAEEADHGKEHNHETTTEAYKCVMGCEGDKTYDEPGKCPVCGMALEKVEHDASDNEEAGHHGSSDHMQHMNDVKTWLTEELGDEYDKPVAAATEEQLALGEQVYKRLCWTCHGMGGKGDGPAAAGLQSKPADFTDPVHSSIYSDQGRLHIIRNGVKGTTMVGWKGIISDEEVQGVYAYVRSLRASGGEGHDDGHGHGGESGHH